MSFKQVGSLGLAAVMSLGCNALTGADAVELQRGSGGGGGGSVALAAADGVAIEAIFINQAVSRALMENGEAPTTKVPIVAGRDALFRVHYSTTADFSGEPVTLRVTVGDNEPVEEEVTLGSAPSEVSDLSSTANITVPGELIDELTDYRVELLQPETGTSGDNAQASHPAPEEEPELLPARSTGDSIKVRIVAIKYDADGSGRLPDLSDAQLELISEKFYQRYPTPDVEIRIGMPFAWDQPVSGAGFGWGELLQAMVELRSQTPDMSDDEHLYGMFQAADSFSEFCGGGCLAGLSKLGTPSDPLSRVGIGHGFPGEGAAETAVHEVGHQQGRRHAPGCGAGNPDENYPNPGAELDVWGYDLVNEVLVDPSDTFDFMSYCDPTWVSAYNFTNIFTQLMQANQLDRSVPRFAEPRRYLRIAIAPDGKLSWLRPLTLSRPPAAEPVKVLALTAAGTKVLEGVRYRYSHLAGGALLLPEIEGIRSLRITLDGQLRVLAR